MTAVLATVRNYDELQAAMRVRADALKISREKIDAISGLPKGFASKVLAEVPLRRLGPDTVGHMCWALGIKLQVVEDEKAMSMFTAEAGQRVESYALNAAKHGGAVHFKISLRNLKRRGRKGGQNSRKYMTRAQARKLAKKASRARWHKLKVAEIKLAEGSAVATHPAEAVALRDAPDKIAGG